jgi:hypothetical protein
MPLRRKHSLAFPCFSHMVRCYKTITASAPRPLPSAVQRRINDEYSHTQISRFRSEPMQQWPTRSLCKILCHNVHCAVRSVYEYGVDPNFLLANKHSDTDLQTMFMQLDRIVSREVV